MVINKKLIHFKNKTKFEEKNNAGEILDSSIVFVKDSNEIYTHGEEYQFVGWSYIKSNSLITFKILYHAGTEFKEYNATPGMTWEEWVNSDYNIDGYVINKYDNVISTSSGRLWSFAIKPNLSENYVNPTDTIDNGSIYYYD